MSDQTRIQCHTYLFARDAQEGNIVPHNLLLLAYFRCHHCLEVIHSEQCIGYVPNVVERIPMPAAYPCKMFFMRVTPSPALTNRSILLQLVFRLPLDPSLAFVAIGVIT
jgi:hypothetical protein